MSAVLQTQQKTNKKKSVYFLLMNEIVHIQKGTPVIQIYYAFPSGIALGGLLHASYLNTFTIHLCISSVPSALGYVSGHCQFMAVNSLPSTRHESALEFNVVVLLQAWWLQDKREQGLAEGEIHLIIPVDTARKSIQLSGYAVPLPDFI